MSDVPKTRWQRELDTLNAEVLRRAHGERSHFPTLSDAQLKQRTKFLRKKIAARDART